MIATVLAGIHDFGGNFIRNTTAVGGLTRYTDRGVWYTSRVAFTADADDTYYVAVGTGFDTGAYTLSMSRVADDFAAGTWTSGTVEVGGSVTGAINYMADSDWFAATLEAGRLYEFHVRGATIPSIRNPDGGFRDDTGRGHKVFFIPEENATYYVPVEPAGYDRSGTYTLSLTDVTDVPDGASGDIVAGTGTSGTVEVDGSATGEIEIPGDRDWFEVSLEAGKTYRIDLKGWMDKAGTLWTPHLYGVHDAHGTQIRGEAGDAGFRSQVYFAAPEDTTYYVAAGAWEVWEELYGMWGTYTLSVEEVTDGM